MVRIAESGGGGGAIDTQTPQPMPLPTPSVSPTPAPTQSAVPTDVVAARQGYDAARLARANAECAVPVPGASATKRVADMSATEKLGEAIKRALPHLPGEARNKLAGLLEPKALAAMAAVLGVWAASHAFGVGEVVDVLMLVGGVAMLGWDAIGAAKDLAGFVQGALGAKTEADLDHAGERLARAVSTIGIDAVLVFLTHKAAGATRGGAVTEGKPPVIGELPEGVPTSGALRRFINRPSVTGDSTLPAGEGFTDKYGNITYSTQGSLTDQALVRYHEQVHSFLSPKLNVLREFRADLRMSVYQKSSLMRYTEEALAETYAQLKVNGIKGLPEGIRFPVTNGYVTVSRVVTEAAIGTIVIGGATYAVYVTATKH